MIASRLIEGAWKPVSHGPPWNNDHASPSRKVWEHCLNPFEMYQNMLANVLDLLMSKAVFTIGSSLDQYPKNQAIFLSSNLEQKEEERFSGSVTP